MIKRIMVLAVGALIMFIIGYSIGHSGNNSDSTKVQATASPHSSVIKISPAHKISDDGVYVVGTDIVRGTWHTDGGAQCYEATLSGLDTMNDIIDNNNFSGADTVSLSKATAFEISGGCQWSKI